MSDQPQLPGHVSIDLMDEEQHYKTMEPAKITKAVALGYDRKEDPAPKIIASGKGAVAEQILALAFANGVKVREDADLVEVLSKIDIDSFIPLEAFAAVAEILSYVYRANGSTGQS